VTPSDTYAWRITPEQLEMMREDRARLHETERRVKAEREQLEKLIDAAEGFLEIIARTAAPRSATMAPDASVTPTLTVSAPSEAATRKRGASAAESWTETIQRIVDGAVGPMTYDDLKAEVAKTHLGERLRENDKGFYGALLKQERKGKLVRYKGHVFAAETFGAFKEKIDLGLESDFRHLKGGRKSPLKQAVLDLLAECELGATTSEIIDKMLKAPPEVSGSVRRNRTTLYNLLSRMTKRGEIIRKGNVYSLPSDRNEPPTSAEDGGSKPDGVAAPSMESPQRLRATG